MPFKKLEAVAKKKRKVNNKIRIVADIPSLTLRLLL